MNGLLELFGISLRLYFRNKMGMFYGYLFAAVFLLAFWVLYRAEPIPLLRHMGQLLTVTILGGACLGMPTTMVSERERGVWRRYRLTPASTPSLVAGSVIVRYFILITAGVLQLALAGSAGMPLPRRPLELGLAFTCVAFAFLGLGLVVAAIADNVPSVQALGQCIFLPMLIVGGVAVPLASLPDWALHISAFLPGRYAVETLQACIAGNGAGSLRFDFLALLAIGLAGFIAGGLMFRSDARQRFASRNKWWLTVVVACWVAVGLLAESRSPKQEAPPPKTVAAIPAPARVAPAPAATGKKPVVSTRRSSSWQEVTIAEITGNVDFGVLPPDSGIISPIAKPGLAPPAAMVDQINGLTAALPEWPPGNVADPVQKVRNLMYVAAVPDVGQAEILESYVPLVVFDRLRKIVKKDDLVKLLYWVAVHPSGGDDSAARQLQPLGLGSAPADIDAVRERVTFYSLKLLGRMIGRIRPR